MTTGSAAGTSPFGSFTSALLHDASKVGTIDFGSFDTTVCPETESVCPEPVRSIPKVRSVPTGVPVGYRGDALWEAGPDGGDVTFVDGDLARSGGLPGATYISLFGGNDSDGGEQDSRVQWWGNHLEDNDTGHIRGRTGTLLLGLPMSGPNLLRIQDAAEADLAWMTQSGVATSVTVEAAIEGAKRLRLTVEVQTGELVETFVFRENWRVEI